MTSQSSWDVVVWNNWLLLGRKSSDLLVRKFLPLFLWQSPMNYYVFSPNFKYLQASQEKDVFLILWTYFVSCIITYQRYFGTVLFSISQNPSFKPSLSSVWLDLKSGDLFLLPLNLSHGCVIFSCWVYWKHRDELKHWPPAGSSYHSSYSLGLSHLVTEQLLKQPAPDLYWGESEGTKSNFFCLHPGVFEVSKCASTATLTWLLRFLKLE